MEKVTNTKKEIAETIVSPPMRKEIAESIGGPSMLIALFSSFVVVVLATSETVDLGWLSVPIIFKNSPAIFVAFYVCLVITISTSFTTRILDNDSSSPLKSVFVTAFRICYIVFFTTAVALFLLNFLLM